MCFMIMAHGEMNIKKKKLTTMFDFALCRSHWPRGVRRGSVADRLLGLRV